jgi:hypothetical protein
VSIDGVFQSYLDALRRRCRSLGVAEENIQARIRGATLMAFSNTEGAMLPRQATSRSSRSATHALRRHVRGLA